MPQSVNRTVRIFRKSIHCAILAYSLQAYFTAVWGHDGYIRTGLEEIAKDRSKSQLHQSGRHSICSKLLVMSAA